MARFPIGERIRQQRRKSRLTQAELADAVGISTSYLNLIENEKRPIGGALLNRIASALDVVPAHLSGNENLRLTQDLLELIRTYPDTQLDEGQALQLIAASSDWAHAFLRLHRRYREASETATALSDRLSQDSALIELSHAVLARSTAVRSFAEIVEQHPDLESDKRQRYTGIVAAEAERLGASVRAMMDLLGAGPANAALSSPGDEVDDFINYNRSHFPDLEHAAESLRHDFGDGNIGSHALAERLESRHGIELHTILRADETRPETSRRFLLARHLVEMEFGELLDDLAADRRFITSDAARALSRRALTGYGASALLFPYDRFLEAAEARRYDIEYLAQRFGGSFEQIAHRLVTLRRPGAEGIPFAFLRSDPAGNLSKRFSTLGLHMPRFGGACPLWPLYGAFRTPGNVTTQLAVMPEGERYLLIARCVSKRLVGYGQPETLFSIMIGCDASYSSRVIYGDRYATGSDASGAPVGFGCRSCSRTGCAQRAHASVVATDMQPKDTRVTGLTMQ